MRAEGHLIRAAGAGGGSPDAAGAGGGPPDAAGAGGGPPDAAGAGGGPPDGSAPDGAGDGGKTPDKGTPDEKAGGPPPGGSSPLAGGMPPPLPPVPPLGGGSPGAGGSNKLDMETLKSTDEGRKALKTQQDNKVNIVRGQPGEESSYDPKTNTLTLDPTDPDVDSTFVRKMAEVDYLKEHKGDPNLDSTTATSRDAFINAQLDKEAHAHAKEIEYRLEAGQPSNDSFQDAFQKACDAFKHDHPNATQDQLNAAGEKAIRDMIGKTPADGSKAGQTFEQLYGGIFDAKSKTGASGIPPAETSVRAQSILELMASGKL